PAHPSPDDFDLLAKMMDCRVKPGNDDHHSASANAIVEDEAPMNSTRRSFIHLGASAAFAAFPGIASAQQYPSRPVRIVVSRSRDGSPCRGGFQTRPGAT